MSKVHKFPLPPAEVGLPDFSIDLRAYWDAFLASELGGIYQSLPWSELAKCLGLREKARGRDSIFSPEGKLALMFLKSYCGCSDERLLSQLNGNLDFQFFVGF